MTTTDRLQNARELIIRAVAVLSQIEPAPADAGTAAALAITADLKGAGERLARLIGAHPLPLREYRNEYGEVTNDPRVVEDWRNTCVDIEYRDTDDRDWHPIDCEDTEAAPESPRDGA